MSDPLEQLIVLPHCTMEFIAGMVWSYSQDGRGPVHFIIRANEGRTYYKFVREPFDQTVPVHIRKEGTNS